MRATISHGSTRAEIFFGIKKQRYKCTPLRIPIALTGGSTNRILPFLLLQKLYIVSRGEKLSGGRLLALLAHIANQSKLIICKISNAARLDRKRVFFLYLYVRFRTDTD